MLCVYSYVTTTPTTLKMKDWKKIHGSRFKRNDSGLPKADERSGFIKSYLEWQIEGEDLEAVTDFTFLGSMITADGDSSQEIRRHLLLGRKTMTNLDNIFKSRDITLPTKV